MESASYGRATRTTVFVALFVAAIMMVGPALRLGDHDLSPADSASAQTDARVLRTGWSGFAGGVKTLNPFVYTMGQEYMVIWPCYSFLLMTDENSNVIGDLITEYTVSPDGKTWHIWIVSTASFYNKNTPTVQELLTVDDVMFTFWLNQNNTGSVFNYYFPELPGTGGPLIESMTKFGDYEMEFNLRAAFAPFASAFLGIPIVPEYIWQNEPWNWPNFAKNKGIPGCVGSGHMYYGFDDLRAITTVGQAELYDNPTWFGTQEYGWQSHIHKLTIKSETDSSAILDFTNGVIDVIISPTPEQYTTPGFPGADADKFSSSQGFVMYVSINQLSLADRADFNIGGPGDYNSQIVLDPVVARALKMSVNKTSIVANDLLGGGSPADTLMPTTSPWVYHYSESGGPGVIPNDGDPGGARQLLMANGWKYRETPPYLEVLPTDTDYLTYYPLCKVGGTEVLRFRLFSPDQYTFFDGASRRVVITGQQSGFDLQYPGPTPTNTANVIWSTADYELLLWDWWFSPPPTEPSLDVMEIYTSMAIGGSSDCNYHNDSYDALYYRSLSESDPVGRRALLDELQTIAYLDAGCWPIAYRDVLYGIRTVGPNFWHNWGNWQTNYPLCVDSGYPWLFTMIYPEDNPSPSISSFTPSYESDTLTPVHFSATVTDTVGTELLYRWNFGDGTKSPWLTSASVDHTYTKDGHYNAHFWVKENNTADGFMSHATAKVTVIDISNTLPHDLVFTCEPSGPDSGTVIYLNGTATDDEHDPMTFTWTFGDGTAGRGEKVTHQFTAGAGIYTVYMYVDDGRLGADPRPEKTSNTVQVTLNGPPLISVRDEPSVPHGSPFTYRITASDPNARDHLRFMWDWGDGSVSVTTTQTADHQYKFVRDYLLTVWADDRTGITSPMHNVSDTGLIHVYRGSNIAPRLTDFSVSDETPTNEQTVTISATPVDDNGDIVQVTFNFGDSTPTVVVTQLLPNETVSADHVYTTAGLYFPSLAYTDFTVAPITEASFTWGWYMTVSRAEFTLNLLAGWNLVTVPRIGEGYTARTLGLENDDIVAGYNSTTQGYDQAYIVGFSPPESDFAINESTGYWIYAGGARTLHLNGTISTEPMFRTITVPAGGGWALVGLNTLSTTMLASDIPGMFAGGTIDVVASYDTVTGAYNEVYITEFGLVDFALVPGQAYWCACSASGMLSYVP